MRAEEAEVLERRSRRFLDEAEDALNKRYYDVCCFLAEQALQLRLKAGLLKIAGDYPRTHSVRRFLAELIRAVKTRKGRYKRMEDFVRENRSLFSELEDAYLMSRYFIKDYQKEDAEELLDLVKRAMSELEATLRELHG